MLQGRYFVGAPFYLRRSRQGMPLNEAPAEEQPDWIKRARANASAWIGLKKGRPRSAAPTLEIAATFGVATIAIQFDQLPGTFTRSTAVLATRLGGTRAGRILTLFLFVVSHETPP